MRLLNGMAQYQLISLAIWCRYCFARVNVLSSKTRHMGLLQENIDKYRLALYFNLIYSLIYPHGTIQQILFFMFCDFI